MSAQHSRRTFLKACGAVAVTMPFISTRAMADNRISYWMNEFDEDLGEETALRRAMNVVAGRFQAERVWQNVYNVRPSRYNIKGTVMDESNLRDTDENRRNLLWHQLYWLSQPNSPNDTEPAFPDVHLNAFHEKSDVLAYAKRGDHVVVRSSNGSVHQSGEFRIYINRYKLCSGGSADTDEEWAATIAHEMLHNLGHLHEKGDYTDEWQINVLNNAVLNNGYYRNPRYRWNTSHMH